MMLREAQGEGMEVEDGDRGRISFRSALDTTPVC